MNDFELNDWIAETNRSTRRWVIDKIHNGKDGQDFLAYRGGENGSYIEISPEGVTRVGTYEGAFPHIGDALFHPWVTIEGKSFDEAVHEVILTLGNEMLLEYFGINL